MSKPHVQAPNENVKAPYSPRSWNAPRGTDWAAKARAMSPAGLDFATKDIYETLALHIGTPPGDPYVAKLYAELDAIRDERMRRNKGVKA